MTIAVYRDHSVTNSRLTGLACPGVSWRVLVRTRAGLVDQIDEAAQHGWLGEIERLEHI